MVKKKTIVCRCEDLTLDEVERAIDEGYTECSKELLLQFLDGFIITKRGPRDDGKPAPKNVPLNNNLVLKKGL